MCKYIYIIMLFFITLLSCSQEEFLTNDEISQRQISEVYLKYYNIQDVMPPRVTKDGVLFTFSDNYFSVEVSGDFNNWEGGIPLIKSTYGVYYYLWQEPLKAGTYSYRYRVDGVWINDPISDMKYFDDIGQEVSYFVVENDMNNIYSNPIYNENGSVTFFYSNVSANEVMFTSSHLGFDSSRYSMIRGVDNIWRITLNIPTGNYYYNFIVDGKWSVDPLNINVVEGSDNILHSQVFIE